MLDFLRAGWYAESNERRGRHAKAEQRGAAPLLLRMRPEPAPLRGLLGLRAAGHAGPLGGERRLRRAVRQPGGADLHRDGGELPRRCGAEDRAAVRALFSENVRETDEDFDAQLDLLFEADLDASAFWDRDDIQLQGSYRHDDGRHAAVVQDTFPIRDRGRYYWCTLELTYTDDFDPGEVGITALAFYSAEYYCALLYEAADAEWPAGSGLDVRTAYPADGDIRAAGGSPYRFENDTPPLEEDAVRDFLGQTDSWNSARISACRTPRRSTTSTRFKAMRTKRRSTCS